MTTVTERQIVQHETRPASAGHDGGGKADDPKSATGPDDGYVMIKCGNNTVLYNNRNPNSAVRQLFPATKFVCPPTRIKETDDARLLNKYLITEESLRAFDSRSLNGGGLLQATGGGFRGDGGRCSDDDDDDDDDTSNSLIRRTIERSTLRRNTAKKKTVNDTKEISLIEKIRRLTCDSDDDDAGADACDPAKKVATAAAQEQSAAYAALLHCDPVQTPSTTAAAPAYKKLSDLFGGGSRYEQPLLLTPDPATGKPTDALDLCDGHASSRATAVRPATVAVGKPFLSTLATACVTGNVQHPAVAGGGGGSSAGTGGGSTALQPPPSQCPQPDVVAGTQAPGSHCRQEELAAFVQQDSGRLEKIRKRYMPPAATTGGGVVDDDEDDENDDYGFNRRPEVHGIRSGFSAQITIKNNHHHHHQQQQQLPPPQRPRSYYGDPARPTPPPPALDVRPDFVPRYQSATVRARIQADPRSAPPPYPAASQRSIIRVTHGQQQQTIRVPYQAVGPVQVHLLTTTAATNVQATAGHHPQQHQAQPPPPPPPSQLQIRHPANEYIVQAHGHARIHHGQQFVIARGTQTAAISTTRYYQLPPPPPPNHHHHHHQQQQQQQPPPPPPSQQQLPQPMLAPQAFQLADDVPAMTACTAGGRQQHEFAVEHGLQPSSVAQTPKNPMLFYGMNV